MSLISKRGVSCVFATFLLGSSVAWGGDPAVLKPRVPPDRIEEARTWQDPFPDTPERLERGREIFHGKGFCVTCHGRDGKGLDNIPGLRGKLPRNFTDKAWQAVRTDGELFWILKNGSPGTDMASFIPLVLTEEEAWDVLSYVRAFGGT
ncbi:MAG: cytochrome c [Nitrospira sp. SB0677_bin_15]|nr:cytochrome c [Nitrospira sp. SB0667_bin_9]MYD31717.1 cytochrome c [Nitrospira sp. SB0661_bin_20]MYG39286.1 cytochrome c [Nitrospira sp. SB0677_bin_15]MYH02174.1 cytochrome c [Nitrospira sp. SB0675_bin_23]MYJ22876.1 cytochrome c [Nitrospira sp. SB0673_bin_12]